MTKKEENLGSYKKTKLVNLSQQKLILRKINKINSNKGKNEIKEQVQREVESKIQRNLNKINKKFGRIIKEVKADASPKGLKIPEISNKQNKVQNEID